MTVSATISQAKLCSLLVSAMTLSAALTASAAAAERAKDAVIATKGAVAVSALDVRAQNIQLSDRDFDAFRQSTQGYLRSVEDIANARYAASGKSTASVQ